jgi:hypothetical protein
MIDERLSLTCVVASKVYKTFFDAAANAAHANSTLAKLHYEVCLWCADIFICVHMRLMTLAPDPTPILTSSCCNPIYFFFAIIPSLEFKTATLYYFSSSLTAENFQYVARYFQVFVMFLQQLLYTKYKGCK